MGCKLRVLPNSQPVTRNSELYGLRYAEFVVPLVKAKQELAIQLEQLQAENKTLASKINQRNHQIAQYKIALEQALLRLEALENHSSKLTSQELAK